MKEGIKARIDENTSKILANAKDDKLVGKCLEELRLAWKEAEIEPIEVEVLTKDVEKRYNLGGSAEMIMCKTCIVYHQNGYYVVSKPTMANNLKGGALFEMLQWFCDWQDARDEETDEEKKERNDTLCMMIAHLLTVPCDAFTDVEFMVDIADYIINRRARYYESLVEKAKEEKPETLEDALDNLEFEAETAISEQIAGEIVELGKKKEEKDKEKAGK